MTWKYLMVLILFSCSSGNDQEFIYFDDSTQKVNYTFEDAFTMIDSFTFHFEDEERVIPRIRQIYINEQGEIFLGDYHNGTVVRFSSDGKYLEDIGSRGKGPGEFDFMGNYFIDSDNNLWVFDAGMLRMNRFTGPTYEYHDAFTIENRLGNFAVMGSGIIAMSRAYDQIFKYSKNGELLKQESIVTNNEDMRIFLTIDEALLEDGRIIPTSIIKYQLDIRQTY